MTKVYVAPCGETGGAAHFPQRWPRSFGRRKGRTLSLRQSTLLAEGLQNRSIDVSQPLDALALKRLFPESVRDIWLEIGFGGGEHLVWQVANNPRVGVIGAEPYLNGVVSAMDALVTRELTERVRVYADDVLALLRALPPECLSRAFMLFPDPWPKKRHRERRLFSAHLLDKLAPLLRPEAEFRFASDIDDYAEVAIEAARAHPAFDIARVFTTENRDTMPDWPVTRYEEKARKQGRGATFLVLQRAI
ncbi:tRNA (guanosine(46)-N7)-methyltransferase TrmB [Rhodomicrobium vannielii ATCC 17100]|uniref:tRNA (guanine(46)-N(7))-methyltransferase TrmB n=1 Tax=Rhodomicrobium vannielii TaxID=1069 RepID=UPI00191A2A40|nr:tRNA (guanosine(46)-N7)-methyltransferase TrmB [Rhodomicrobium vannielii ATCC 17100]